MIRRLVPALITAAIALAPASALVQKTTCDEACLTDLANRYMDAVVKHDPKGLPWAERVGYAENGVKLRIGEGSWVTIDARGKAPVVVADPENGHVVWIGSVNDHGQPGFYAMDMEVEGRKIAAVNAVIRRQQGRPPFGDPVAFAHDAKFGARLGRDAATPANAMVVLVEGFFNSQAASDGTVLTTIGEGCQLIENGVPMTGNLPAAAGGDAACDTALKRGLFQEYEAVRRQIVAVDGARGVVAAIGYRDLPGASTSFVASDGTAYAAEAKYPRSVAFVTLFKIEGGKIARIETVANEVPYLMPFPWTE